MSKFNNKNPNFFKDIDILYEGCGYVDDFDKNQYHSFFRILYFEDVSGIISYNDCKYYIVANQVMIIRPNRVYRIGSELENIKYYDFNFLDKKSMYNIDKLFETQSVYSINENDYFSQCFKMALLETQQELGAKKLLLSGIGFIFLSLIFRSMQYLDCDKSARRNVSRNNIFLISEIEKSLNDDFAYNSKVYNLAYSVGISENKLYKVIKDTFDLSPKEWIMQQKIQKIKIMLVERKSYSEIIDTLAFCSVSHMSSCFKKHTGYTLNNYLKKYSNK